MKNKDIYASVVIIVFGGIWLGVVYGTGAPNSFPMFGLAFICMGLMNIVIKLINAAKKNHTQSYDMSDEDIDKYFKNPQKTDKSSDAKVDYCPYCGFDVDDDHKFCQKCGKKLR